MDRSWRPVAGKVLHGAGPRRISVSFAAAAVVLVAALVGVALLLSQAQSESWKSAEKRFSERAQVSAALTQSVFSALSTSSGQALPRQFSAPGADLPRHLTALMDATQLRYVAVVDGRGRTLAAVGHLPRRLALAGSADGGPLLSDVVHAAGVPVVEYAIPFGSGQNRRALVRGIPLVLMSMFLNDYFGRLRSLDDAGLALTDTHGAVITRQGRIASNGRASSNRFDAAAMVPGTPWTLTLEADRDRVLAGVNRLEWLPWLLLAALALAALTGMRLYANLARSVRRQRAVNVALHESREQGRKLVDALEEAVVLYHADGRTELLNASAKELFDTEAGVLHGLAPGWELLDEGSAPLAEDDTPIRKALATGTACSEVMGLRRPDGSRRWLTVRARPLMRPGEERPRAVVASCTDVTEQREMELHLTDLAQRDPLTGLWNRRRFEYDLAQQLARCRRYGERAALLVLDLDGFKQVNDTLGHLAGDEVLRALASGLSQRLRASDIAARIGGDEFAVLLVNVDKDEAREMVTEVAARLGDFARDEFDARVDLSVSIGVAALGRETAGVPEAFAAADAAMYEDKHRSGRSPAGGNGGPAGAAELISNGAGRGERDLSHVPALQALLTAVQARDHYTAGHSRQVVTLARAVARRLGLDDAHVSEVENVALLHDLGKIAVPDAILRKAGPLTDQELLIMRQHPAVGAEMVSSIPDLEHLAPAIRAEHERWDGDGYPDGLAGEAIPPASRIAFVCDAYHAMTSDRPYRNALSREAAIAEIAREAGRQFCPHAARALLDVLSADATKGQQPAGGLTAGS